MRYLMRQKWLSLGDDFFIQDEQGRDVFRVDGKAFCFGDQLSFQDLAGNELAFIKQRLLAWGPTYEIYQGGELLASVTKELFSLFKCRFSVDVPGPDDLTAEGDFLDHEYAFYRGNRQIATISKQWFSWTDTYGVEIAHGNNDLLVLAATVVIDMACHEKD
jgi:uncharacterized protein YxjI